MNTTKNERGIRPTPFQYFTGMFAVALACLSFLYISVYTTPTQASPGSHQANGKTTSGQVVFDETETPSPTMTTTASPTATNTASPTVTNTPSPTVTTTSTPTPSPSATSTTIPSPTSTRSATQTATVQPSPAATSTPTPSQTAPPTSNATAITISAQGAGANQTPISSPASMNNQSDAASQRAQHPGNTVPFSALMIGLGSVTLFGVLLIAGWMIVRRRLLPVSSPKLPPSGAAPWSRTRTSDQQEQAMQAHINPTSSIDQSFDWSYLAERIRQRRNELRATDSLPACQKQAPGELSAEIAELNDPYLQSLIQLYKR